VGEIVQQCYALSLIKKEKIMKLEKKKELIKNVAARFKESYFVKGVWVYNRDGNKESIYNNLVSKKPKTEEDIEEIIGNDSWTSNRCNQCRNETDVLIRLGEEPDWESNTFFICKDCLEKAINLIKDGA